MKVTVSRSGGFAGLTRSWSVDVDSEPDTESWLVLIDQVPWSQAPASAQAVQPDRFVWVITAETRPTRKAKLPEQQVTGPWRELVDRVRSTSEAEAKAGPTR
ncbi:protealysin inhibitor emfourin [Frigoribacterium sp. R86507]|uniref:protealysin inhibitor emfourin n=1 Tax=Frigoribacterium sp. R86507 TaxID=3093850 RepID=UPI0037C8055D